MTKPYMIAIAGGSGSGKTTIVELISQQFTLKPILVFSQDHYYRDLSHLSPQERHQVNFDHPEQLDTQLMLHHMEELAAGRSIDRPTYDFITHTRSKTTTIINPSPIIIFDGIFSLYHHAVRELCKLKIYVDVGDDLRFIRRLRRDMQTRGRSMESVVTQYLESVRPMHSQYVEPTKAHADFILCWEQKNQQVIHLLVSMLTQLFR